MGCCGDRHRDDDLIHVKAEQKWDYITLTDFRSTSCFTFLSYCILYLTIIKSFAVYGVDTFTAVNLLAFSRWASQIKPKIPFGISKWIFSGCIILSFVLLAYRWIRAIRVIKSGGVAQSYLDPIAVRVQSTRMGSEGQGFRRFLVFAELTKTWLRVIFAEGPRQAINGFTLYSVMELRLIPIGENAPSDGTPAVVQFFNNVEALAEKDKLQATILFAMLFTFVIWVLSILSLALSLIMYLLFLWHHIPSEDERSIELLPRVLLFRIGNERI
ncbi:pheromone-regulated membrane protein 6 [Coccidioides immitis H538.4]|uniref:Pheromone-regulated membrane protein 6 n=1 Tax=Coccidioides immitis H538.4 TaxID=396776 RepID=A0A0J8RFA2_COCIT|nr:pheromone-regulated membrane protein 6 [Coccidioides immitis H538.4]